MGDWSSIAKILIFIGVLIVILGFLILGLGKLVNLGRLPGDFVIRKGNFTLFFPLATSLILSIILTVLLNIFLRR